LGNIPDVFNVEDAVKEKISTKQKENLATANTQYSTFKKRVEINKTADKDLLNVVTPAAMKALFWLET